MIFATSRQRERERDKRRIVARSNESKGKERGCRAPPPQAQQSRALFLSTSRQNMPPGRSGLEPRWQEVLPPNVYCPQPQNTNANRSQSRRSHLIIHPETHLRYWMIPLIDGCVHVWMCACMDECWTPTMSFLPSSRTNEWVIHPSWQCQRDQVGITNGTRSPGYGVKCNQPPSPPLRGSPSKDAFTLSCVFSLAMGLNALCHPSRCPLASSLCALFWTLLQTREKPIPTILFVSNSVEYWLKIGRVT